MRPQSMPGGAHPQVSIVIVCWNSSVFLPGCLAGIQAQTYKDLEVIVIDNASTDGCADGLERRFPALPLQVFRLDNNTGFAAGNNIGAQHARGQWLALINPDAVAEPDWLEQLMLAAARQPACFFASRQIQARHPRLLDGEGDVYFSSGLARRNRFNFPVYAPGPARECFSACAAAALYPRAAFLEAGGFDEDYFAYHEDVDLGFRLRLRGLRAFVVPRAIVRHVGGSGTGYRSRFAIYHGHRNLVWTYFKNMPAPYLWLFLPVHLITNLVVVLYYVLVGRGATIVGAKWDAFRGLGRVMSKRKSVQAERRVPKADLLDQMDLNPLGPLQGWMQRTWP